MTPHDSRPEPSSADGSETRYGQMPADAQPEAEPYEYSAFISYRHVDLDRKVARWLHTALERYRVPAKLVRDRGVAPRLKRVFRDEEELAASSDLNREIETALRGSRFLIVVCSPRTPASQWVSKEVLRFREWKRDDRILALLIEGEPSESFPRSLCEIRRNVVDKARGPEAEVEEIEPLAADIRRRLGETTGHIRRMAKLRILACILGCRFDELRQREQERQARRLMLTGTLLALLAVMLIALTAFAFSQKNEAERQRGIAEDNEKAERKAAAAAEAKRKESRGRLVRSFLREGSLALDERDPLRALPWLAEAAREDGEDTKNDRLHRVRLAAVFRSTPRVVQVFGHEKNVAAVAFSPDGRRVAIAAGDAVRVWEVYTGQPVTPPLRYDRGPKPDGPAPPEAPDRTPKAGKQHKTQDEGNMILASPPRRFAPMKAVTFSRDGRYLVTVSDEAQVWEVGTGRPVGKPLMRPMRAVGEYVQRVLFSPDGQRLVTLSRTVATVWQTRSWQLMSSFSSDDEIRDACFSPDSSTFLTASGKRVIIWKPADGQRARPPLEHVAEVRKISLSADSRYLVAVCADGKASVWDAVRWQLLQDRLDAHVIHAAFSPDSRLLATACLDGSAALWEPASGRRVSRHLPVKGPHSVGFSPDGRFVLTARLDGLVQVWDKDTGRRAAPPLTGATKLPSILTEDGSFGVTGTIRATLFSPDGRHVLTATEDLVLLWDFLPDDRPITQGAWPPKDRVRTLLNDHPPGRNPVSLRLAISPDSRRLLRFARELLRPGRDVERAPEAGLFDAATLEPLLPFRDAHPMHCVFSPDGRRVATAKFDGKANVWDADSGKLLFTVQHGRNSLKLVAFSPDGQRLATVSVDGTARVWDRGGRAVAPPLVHGGHIDCLAFSRDGRYLVTAGTRVRSGRVSHDTFEDDLRSTRGLRADPQGLARVWEVDTGQPRPLTCTHDKSVSHAAFSGDGRYVVTASEDHTARVWDVRVGKAIARPLRHSAAVYHAAFGADPRYVITSTLPGPQGTGETCVWDAMTGEPITPRLRHPVFYPDYDLYRFVFFDKIGVLTKVPTDVAWIMSGPPPAELTADFRLVVRLNAYQSWTWKLGSERGTIEQLVLEARLRSGMQIDATGSHVPADVPTTWRLLREHAAPPDGVEAERAQLGWHRRQAELCESAGNSFATLWHLDHLLKGGEEDWELHFRRGNALAQLIRWKEALAAYSLGLQHQKHAWQLWAARGKVYAHLGQSPEALSDCNEALRLNPKAAEAYVTRGIALVAQRLLHKALAEYTRAIHLDSELWEAWAHRGEVRNTQGIWALAVDDLTVADRLQPGVWWVLRGRARAYRELKEWKKAEADYDQALSLNDNDADSWYGRGFVRLLKGDRKGYAQTCAEALARFEKTASPETADSVAALCVLAPGALTDPGQCVRLAETAVASAPQACKFRHTLAAALYRAGQHEKAEQEFRTAVQLCARGGTASDWYFLALCCHRRGNAPEAHKLLEKANSAVAEGAKPGAKDSDFYATARLRLQLLRSEVETLLRGK